MRLTPKQAEAVAVLIDANPGEGAALVPGAGRAVIVVIGKTEYTIGGRGKVSAPAA